MMFLSLFLVFKLRNTDGHIHTWTSDFELIFSFFSIFLGIHDNVTGNNTEQKIPRISNHGKRWFNFPLLNGPFEKGFHFLDG